MNRALKVAIVASGRKQKDVAKRAGMDQWRLSRIISEDVAAKPAERARIARVLRTRIDQLFEAVS